MPRPWHWLLVPFSFLFPSAPSITQSQTFKRFLLLSWGSQRLLCWKVCAKGEGWAGKAVSGTLRWFFRWGLASQVLQMAKHPAFSGLCPPWSGEDLEFMALI